MILKWKSLKTWFLREKEIPTNFFQAKNSKNIIHIIQLLNITLYYQNMENNLVPVEIYDVIF